MEVQIPPQQQSVQINLNNKIITLHNVTIVKNPRIVKVDAAQYSSLLLKGASGPIKFINGAATTTPTQFKLPVPSLVPMTKGKSVTNLPVQTPVIQTVIKQAPSYVTTQVIKTIQPQQQITFVPHLKTTTLFAPPINGTSNTQIKNIPVKQQPTVIISPPKSISPHEFKIPSPARQHPPLQQLSPGNSQYRVHFQAPPALSIPSQTSVITNSQQMLISSIPQKISPVLNGNSASIQAKVIVAPPIKAEEIRPPSPKRSKLEFQCIFCKQSFFDDMRKFHPEKIAKSEPTEETKIPKKEEISMLQKEDSSSSSSSSDSDSTSGSSSSSSSSSSSEDSSDEEMDDDASEVNDLINDLENTQDTAESSLQERSNTPESPEFEEHLPSQSPVTVAIKEEFKEEIDDFLEADDDDYEWDCKL
jgi:hypothetical protein